MQETCQNQKRSPLNYFKSSEDLWSLGICTYLLLRGAYPRCESQSTLDDQIASISSRPAREMLQAGQEIGLESIQIHPNL